MQPVADVRFRAGFPLVDLHHDFDVARQSDGDTSAGDAVVPGRKMRERTAPWSQPVA
jgi:hypothetical protein